MCHDLYQLFFLLEFEENSTLFPDFLKQIKPEFFTKKRIPFLETGLNRSHVNVPQDNQVMIISDIMVKMRETLHIWKNSED